MIGILIDKNQMLKAVDILNATEDYDTIDPEVMESWITKIKRSTENFLIYIENDKYYGWDYEMEETMRECLERDMKVIKYFKHNLESIPTEYQLKYNYPEYFL